MTALELIGRIEQALREGEHENLPVYLENGDVMRMQRAITIDRVMVGETPTGEIIRLSDVARKGLASNPHWAIILW